MADSTAAKKAPGVTEDEAAAGAGGAAAGAVRVGGVALETAPEPEGVTGALNRDAVLARAECEPGWLRDRRLAAWDVYERVPLPSTKLEEWRYTDIKRALKIEALELAEPRRVRLRPDQLPGLMQQAMEEDRASAGRLAQVDADVVHVELDPELAAKGVILCDLGTAAREHEEIVERHLATDALPAERGKFMALSAALWTGGTFLYVPAGVHVDLPVRVTRWISGAGTAVLPRTLIVAEAGSHVNYVEETLSDDFAGQVLSCDAVEVYAGEGAQVQYVAVQRLGRGAVHISSQRTLAQRDSKLDTLVANLGASLARLDLNAVLLGPGARSEMLGVYFGDDRQHFDHNTRQDHVAPAAWSDLLYKGALDDHATAAFRGLLKVHPGAQQTDAYQTNRNLLLSEHAKANSLPNLEIGADDVKCSHAATVGHLEEETLFYLLSRGISREIAQRLVVLGFLGEVLVRLPLPGVVEKLSRKIEEKLHRVRVG